MPNLQEQINSLPDRLEARFASIERNQQEIFKLLIEKINTPIPSPMTMKEAANYARYSMDHFRRLAVEQKRIPFIRPIKCQKGKILFRKEDIDTFLNQGQASEPASKAGPGRPRKPKNRYW